MQIKVEKSSLPNQYYFFFDEKKYRVVVAGDNLAILEGLTILYFSQLGVVRTNMLQDSPLSKACDGDLECLIACVRYAGGDPNVPNKTMYDIAFKS
jgi:hypothetical protein